MQSLRPSKIACRQRWNLLPVCENPEKTRYSTMLRAPTVRRARNNLLSELSLSWRFSLSSSRFSCHRPSRFPLVRHPIRPRSCVAVQFDLALVSPSHSVSLLCRRPIWPRSSPPSHSVSPFLSAVAIPVRRCASPPLTVSLLATTRAAIRFLTKGFPVPPLYRPGIFPSIVIDLAFILGVWIIFSDTSFIFGMYAGEDSEAIPCSVRIFRKPRSSYSPVPLSDRNL